MSLERTRLLTYLRQTFHGGRPFTSRPGEWIAAATAARRCEAILSVIPQIIDRGAAELDTLDGFDVGHSADVSKHRCRARAVGGALVAAQNAVELGAEPFDGAPALMMKNGVRNSTAMQPSVSNAWPSKTTCSACSRRCAARLLAIPGEPISTRDESVDVMKVVMPTVYRRIVDHRERQHGAVRSAASAGAQARPPSVSGGGTVVYHNFHSSPRRLPRAGRHHGCGRAAPA
jgi:hypothetical protein